VGDADVWVWGKDSLFADSGMVEISWKGTVAEKANSIFSVLEELTVPAVRPSYLEQEMLYIRQIAYRELESQKFTTLMSQAPKKLTTEGVGEFRKKISKAINEYVEDMGDLPDYNPVGAYQAFETGTKHWSIPEGLVSDSVGGKGWDWFETRYRLHHHLCSSNTDEVIDAILNSGGNLISTVDKLRRGVPWGGMSPGADYESGGAGYVFTRLKGVGEASSSRGLVFKPSLVLRTDAISYDGDRYGNVTKSYVNTRARGLQGLITASASGSNETIFKGSVSLLDNLLQVNVSSLSKREKVLQVFRKHGIFKVNGIDIEDLVHVAE
jgi:hypothetical protein